MAATRHWVTLTDPTATLSAKATALAADVDIATATETIIGGKINAIEVTTVDLKVESDIDDAITSVGGVEKARGYSAVSV